MSPNTYTLNPVVLSPRERGYGARRLDGPSAVNPYTAGTDDHNEWEIGAEYRVRYEERQG